ncbi:MAG: cell wall metabolism sensor histidine kinase WalK [Planctomycetota bacterium]|nr:cell wall metabolism sensor histidine kinase WalK [Planctomycetota bacterium]
MFGLRQKLLVGFGGLLAILLMVSGLGVAVTASHRSELDKFLYENYRSVQYGQGMVDSIGVLNDLSKNFAGGELKSSGPDLSSLRASANAVIQHFDENLTAENHNITLHPEEDQLAGRLTAIWTGGEASPAPGQAVAGNEQNLSPLRQAYLTLFADSSSVNQRRGASEVIARNWSAAKSLAQSIISLNLDNMQPINSRVKELSDNALRAMIVLVGSGVLLAVLFTLVISRSILVPLQTLTRSMREVEHGNLDLVVQVRSRDELHQMAEAFNSMAAKLREFRRTNNAKLERTQQSTQLAINSLPDAVAVLSPDGRVEMANASAERIFGLRSDARVSELGVVWLSDLYQTVTRDLLPIEPRGYENTVQVFDEGGGEKFYLPHAVPILDDQRQLLGITIVLADVTNLRRLDEMKSGLLSVVSHELKTPLTSVRMGVHLLLEERIGALTASQNDIVVAIRDDADRLHRIIENLLDMGRLESGGALIDLKPVDAEKVISEAIEPLSASFRDRGIALATEVAGEMPRVMVDQARINHVFNNLLGNALRYTPPGGSVTVSAGLAEKGMVKFSVEDTGKGIPPAFLPRVFERFFRVPGQSSEAGAGLGLAIAKDIVQVHGGTISVESTPGEGTKFSFLLRQEEIGEASGKHRTNSDGARTTASGRAEVVNT